MDSLLSLAYDRDVDYLYARFAPDPARLGPLKGVDVEGTPVAIMVGSDGHMAGFDIVGFRRLSPHRVPLLTGKVSTDHLHVPAGAPWLALSYSGGPLRIALEQDPAEELIEVPDFGAGADSTHGCGVDLAALLARNPGY